MTYKVINIKEELPPPTNQFFIVRYNGSGSWYDGEFDELTGSDICNGWADVIKVWFKPIEE